MAGKKIESIMGEFAKTLNTGVPNLDTSPQQLLTVDIDFLDDNPENFYELSGIEDLASNIQLCGLQQPLLVRETDGGRYMIVSGHRRHAALRMLVDEGNEQFRQVPCLLWSASNLPVLDLIPERPEVGPEVSSLLDKLSLMLANRDTRKMRDADIAKQAEEYQMVLYQLKELGVEFPGRMRDFVAQACGVSKSKLARLNVIQHRLGPEFKPLFDSGKLPEQSAYALAKFPREFQTRLSTVFTSLPTGSTLEKLLGLYKDKGYRWEPQMNCPDGKPCKRGDTFLRHDADCLSSETCGGKTCCLDCRRAQEACYACDKACSKSKAIRKEKRDAAKAANDALVAKTMEELHRKISASAARIVRAADAAGVPDDALVISSQYRRFDAGWLRRLANGEIGNTHLYGDELAPENLRGVASAAKLLHCSADYLLGVTDELTPVATSPAPPPLETPEVPVDEPEPEGDELDDKPAQKVVCWYIKYKTPPIGALLLTYKLTNDGPVLCPAVWDGFRFYKPGHPEQELTGHEYTYWLEIPYVNSGQEFLAEPPAEKWVPLQYLPGQEHPEPGQLAVARFDAEGAEKPIRTIAEWFGSSWHFPHGSTIDAKCVGWFPIPKES